MTTHSHITQNQALNRLTRSVPGTIPVLLAILLASPMASAGFLNPHLEKFENCTQETTQPSKALKLLTRNNRLYFAHAVDGGDSSDALLMRQYGIQGHIYSIPVHSDSSEVTDDAVVVFTGNVYKRDASVPEKLLGGGEDYYYYETRIDNGIYMLSENTFREPPFRICRRATSAG